MDQCQPNSPSVSDSFLQLAVANSLRCILVRWMNFSYDYHDYICNISKLFRSTIQELHKPFDGVVLLQTVTLFTIADHFWTQKNIWIFTSAFIVQ